MTILINEKNQNHLDILKDVRKALQRANRNDGVQYEVGHPFWMKAGALLSFKVIIRQAGQ